MIRALLALLPPAFRRRYAPEMAAVFRERIREARNRGLAAWSGVWIRTVPDLLRTVAVEWWRVPRTSSWAADVRFAGRGLVRRPLFAGVLVTTVAVGVGANTAVFSAVHAVLLRPLPVAEPESLVRVFSRNPAAGQERFFVAPIDLETLRDEVDAAAGFAGWFATETTILPGDGVPPTRIATLGVTPDLFDVLGVDAEIGRTFESGDAAGGAAGEAGPVGVMLTRRGWGRFFGGAPDVVGRSVTYAAGGPRP